MWLVSMLEIITKSLMVVWRDQVATAFNLFLLDTISSSHQYAPCWSLHDWDVVLPLISFLSCDKCPLRNKLIKSHLVARLCLTCTLSYRYKNELVKEDKLNLNALVERQWHKLVWTVTPAAIMSISSNIIMLKCKTHFFLNKCRLRPKYVGS